MIQCHLCGEEILNKELNQHYKITLGNVFSGIFYGEKELYYHKECLESFKELEKRTVANVY